MKEKKTFNLITLMLIGIIIILAGIIIFTIYKNSLPENTNQTVKGEDGTNVVNNVEQEEISQEENIQEDKINIDEDAPDVSETEKFLAYYYEKARTIASEYEYGEFDYNIGEAEITNFDKVMENAFTDNGRMLYEAEDQLINFRDGKVYIMAGSDHTDECLYDIEFEDINITDDMVTATLVRTMTKEPITFMEEDEVINSEKDIYRSKFVVKKENGKWLIDEFSWHVTNMVGRYLSNIYFGTDEWLPEFKDINSANEQWIWECAYRNLANFEDLQTAMTVTKEDVEMSAKQLFGSDLNKEFPKEGLDFWLEPEGDGYFYAAAGIEQDFYNDFEVISVDKKDDTVTVQIVEYKYNEIFLGEPKEFNLYKFGTDEIIKTFDLTYDGEVDNRNQFLFEKSFEATTYVKNNDDKFSKATIILKHDEETGNFYISSVER